MNERRRKSGRLQFLLIAAVFFGPLVFATWLYFEGDVLRPTTSTNHGALLEPILNLGDAAPGSPIHEHNEGHWLLVYSNDAPCTDGCRAALYTSRQSRLMLGSDMNRVRRVFLHGDSPPDTLFIASEHKGLITLEDKKLHDVLADKTPTELPAGGYYLIDPIGNLVLYFDPEIDPRDMVDDIKRLLKLSRIG